jgi:predicted patatin/cPLA2 family phospholipase
MDIDYLIDEVFKKQAPLDVGRIARSQSRLLISVTEHQTGRVAFLHNHRGLDLFEILRASKAIPLVYRKKVTINGVAYVDGSIGMPLAVGIQKAIAEGAGNIIVIRNGSGASMASTLFWRLHAALENDHLARAIGDYLSQQHLEPQVNAGIRMVVIDPSRPLPTHPLDNRRDHLRAAFDLGGEDIRRNSELAMLLDSLNG